MISIPLLLLAASLSSAQPQLSCPILEGDVTSILKTLKAQASDTLSIPGAQAPIAMASNPRHFIGCRRSSSECYNSCPREMAAEWKLDATLCPRQVLEPWACYCYPKK
jgi:hypothetical protein